MATRVIVATQTKEFKGGYKQINKALNICAFEDYLEAQTSRLPEIADVEQITPRVMRVLGQNAGKVYRLFISSLRTITDLTHPWVCSSLFKARTRTS